MTDEQLGLALKDTIKNLFHLRFQSATERLETPSEIRKAKRDVARIRTVQRERQLKALAALKPEQLAEQRQELEKSMREADHTRERYRLRSQAFRIKDLQRLQELASYETLSKEQLTARLGDLKKKLKQINNPPEQKLIQQEMDRITNVQRRRGLLPPKVKPKKETSKSGSQA